MTAPEEAIFVRPAADAIRSAWRSVFSDPLLSLARLKAQATTKDGLGDEEGDGGITLRSVYWRLYHGLLPPPTSQNLFAPTLEISRAMYTSLRRRYLVAPDGRWASDCSPDDQSPSSPLPLPAPGGPEGEWDPLSLDGQSPWKTWFAHQDLRATIRQDVDRTFPDIDYFRIERVRRMMVTMLFLFAVQNPDVGYRQGMHELLAVCLLSVDRDSLEVDANQASSSGSSSQAVMLEAMRTTLDRRWVEHDSYGLFQELMRGAKAFYEWRAEEGPRTKVPNAPVAPIILRCQQLHNSLLRRIDPQLWERFETEGLEPQIWAIRWIRLIFTRELPFPAAIRLWDGIFAEDPGLGLIDYVCIAMLLLIRNEHYSTLLSKLLRYPSSSTQYPFSPHLILAQALFLRGNVTPAGGVEVVLQNQDLLGIRAAPPERTERDDHQPRRLNHGRTANTRPPPPQPYRPGVQGLAQGLFERAQAAGLDKTFYSTVADIRKNLPEGYSSYLPNLPFSPLGTPSPRDNPQFSSIPSSASAIPPRSSFFSPPHNPISSFYPATRPEVSKRPSMDSNISIKSLRDAERDMAELRLAMVGMGKAMNEWMSALSVTEEVAKGDAYNGLGRVRDTLLDAAGCEVEDVVRQWGWHEGLEAPRSRDETLSSAPSSAARPTQAEAPPPSPTPNHFSSPETPKVSSFPTAPRPAVIAPKPTLHLSSRDDKPSTGLSRVPLTPPVRDSMRAEQSRVPAGSAVPRRDGGLAAGGPRGVSDPLDPLAGLHVSKDPLGGFGLPSGTHQERSTGRYG
ncbi:rab-GTPase-TBC domain-containing protein [Dioszegia hungarica]|uniref:Rab-GTPase-TBC domain-containing protein n=1 Tax=Dioszegia hungarica TaxID=4972 RepID=A0AA38LVY7_9TREE|nr:rab-GTPase-TBC domain-containing protein [Dioszegia hungarica]KAI9635956.1 rab-GTPase-TBC domain-containing protein [Dioszegia hungarica]